MKKINIFLLSFIIFFIFSYNSYADTCNDKAYYTLKESTVKLTMKIDNENYRCTGIIINKNANSTGVLTAKHCVENVENPNDVTVNYKYFVSKIYESKTSDIAYLIINQSIKNKNAVNIATFNAQDDESIYTLGLPDRKQIYNCAKALYSTIKRTYSDAKIIMGCSGSGVINSRGKLIGIIKGVYMDKITGKQTGDSYMTNTETIRKFLYKIKVLNQDVIIIK